MSSPVQIADALAAAAQQAARRGSEALLKKRVSDGFWQADLTTDTAIEADYVWLQLWLHQPADGKWEPPTRPRIEQAAESILRRQLQDGGFSVYPGGPTNISATVNAYFALKLAGIDPADARMAEAREKILELGGVQAADDRVKINLSLFRLYPEQHCPVVPVEIMTVPGNGIYEISAWARAILIPLSVVQALNPGRPVPTGFTLEELFLPGAALSSPTDAGLLSWRTLFLKADRLSRIWARFAPARLRARSIDAAKRWILERTDASNGPGISHLPKVYTILALDLLGYEAGHPDREAAEKQFAYCAADQDRPFQFRPCSSTIRQTALGALAVGEAGEAPQVLFRRTAQWLLDREAKKPGDWTVTRPGVEPGGWHFGDGNHFYPAVDETAMVLLALSHMRADDERAQEASARRAIRWLLAMQSTDGGWAAFGAGTDRERWNALPFAGICPMLDTPCADITGRVLESLCQYGFTGKDPAIRRGIEYLVRTQEMDGSWAGRWGVNYLYGTCHALRGLEAAGEDLRESHVLRAGEWIRSIQNADGGWGESCQSYDDRCFVPAPSTPSQTAWAVMGLIAGDDTRSDSIWRGLEFLISQQNDDGTWDEQGATVTAFPKAFYLTDHMYRDAFPLLALASYLKSNNPARGDLL